MLNPPAEMQVGDEDDALYAPPSCNMGAAVDGCGRVARLQDAAKDMWCELVGQTLTISATRDPRLGSSDEFLPD